jgi:hypothetical protein
MPEISILKKTMTILFNARDEEQSTRFFRLPFDVLEGIRSIRVTLRYTSVNQAQLPLFLFDPRGGIRFIKLGEGTSGFFEGNFRLGMTDKSPGSIPGPILPGTWRLLLYKRRFMENIPSTLEIHVTPDADDSAGKTPAPAAVHSLSLEETTFDHQIYNPHPAWYCGELHLHSNESTGRTGIDTIYRAASLAHLDFLALTDHFSAAHWLRIEELKASRPPLFLKSMELSGDYGHANIHGLKSWINPLVDDNAELVSFLSMEKAPSMESIADAVHEQGGLFCINHPQSGLVSWRYHNFPWEKTDLMEVWCLPDGPASFLYPAMWDGLLCRGYHITAVGSSDSHHPTEDGPWKLGQIRNWLYAQELSQYAIIEGLKSGSVYIAYGPAKLHFEALYDNKPYQMGRTVFLSPGKKCIFNIEIDSPLGGNLFIFTDGILYDIIHFDPSDRIKKHRFTADTGNIRNRLTCESYFRIEFHEELVKAMYYGMAYRDHTSMRLLSNPIWLRNISKDGGGA